MLSQKKHMVIEPRQTKEMIGHAHLGYGLSHVQYTKPPPGWLELELDSPDPFVRPSS